MEYGTAYHCTFVGNSAKTGGGASAGTLVNCTLIGNSASESGSGANGSTLHNCTLIGNSATNGGGAYSANLYNCIVYYNSARSNANFFFSDTWGALSYCCTTPQPSRGLNFTDAPLFVNRTAGNLRLQSNSPCVNAGLNAYALGSPDLDGRPRIVGGTVDVGAYEFQGPGMGEFIAWLQQYALPTDGSADFVDSDYDGYNNWQEWSCLTAPTNALSALRMVSAAPAGPNVLVSWQSVAGVSYFLERSTNLAATPPCFAPLATGLPGQPGITSFTDTNAAQLTLLFYRVGVGQ
jgi:hypothetical protein